MTERGNSYNMLGKKIRQKRGVFVDCLKAQTCITSYVEEELTGNELKDFLIHMEHCPNCREELEIYYTLLVGTKQLDEGVITTSNFTQELDDKMNRQLRQITRFERISYQVHGAVALIGLFFVMWTGIKVMDIPVPFLNPPPITWEQEKQFVEVYALPYMFRPVYTAERITIK